MLTTSPPRVEGRHRRAHPPQAAEQVDLDQPLHLLVGEVVEPTVVADTGVVEPRREPAVVVRRGGDEPVGGRVADVVLDPGRGADLLGRTPGGLAVDVRDQHGVPAADHPLGDPPPDPARASGDHTALHGPESTRAFGGRTAGAPYGARMTDPRIAPVEDNLESFARALAASDLLIAGLEPDVVTYHLDRPFPLFNAISAARFAPGTVETRAREVIAPYLERGLPFLWWATPSGHAAELEPLLTGLGFVSEPVPGMYVALDGPVDAAPAGGRHDRAGRRRAVSTTSSVSSSRASASPRTSRRSSRRSTRLCSRSGLRPRPGDPRRSPGRRWFRVAHRVHRRGLQHLDSRGGPRPRHRVRRDGGVDEPRPRARVHHAVLHASESGRPVYERLGFAEVCQVPQLVWMPTDPARARP